MQWVPVTIELVVAATLVLIGIGGFRRRDVM
jgi:putative exporter of polyketide antibiotics